MCKHNPNCACCDVPEPKPCSTYEQGRNGRCVYCDHEKACHRTWGDVFNAARRRGEHADSAAISADMWEMRNKGHRRGRHRAAGGLPRGTADGVFTIG